MENKIVVHMKNGTLLKGITHDFDPDREEFHLLPAEGGGVPVRIRLEEMKALFYVKDYVGNRDFVSRRQFQEAHRAGKKAILTFRDGEKLWGLFGEQQQGEHGFFFYPVDEDDNNIRIFVIRSSLEETKIVT